MEKQNINRICYIEEKIFNSLNLLNIAKVYCDTNYDKSPEIAALSSLLSTILDSQNLVIQELDSICK